MLFDDEDEDEVDDSNTNTKHVNFQDSQRVHKAEKTYHNHTYKNVISRVANRDNSIDNNVDNGNKNKTKNPFMEHKELIAKKQKKADEETAKVYDEFVASFQIEDDTIAKNFVRGGVINHEKHTDATNSNGKSSGRGKYIPSFLPPSFTENKHDAGKNSDDAESNRRMKQSPHLDFHENMEKESISSVFLRNENRNKTKEIDLMLEEMKRYHDGGTVSNTDAGSRITREEASKYGMSMGSFDDGDPNTTNLYVGNISPTVDEQVLMHEVEESVSSCE